jgi:hypothetical protein
LNKKASTFKSILSVQTIVLSATAWAVIALLFFLLFSVTTPGEGHPVWYRITTYVLEEIAFLSAGLLCLRNWRSSQIVSGETVWLALGLGRFSYFVGNLLLGYWEIGLGESPDVSPGDFFFILTYLCLGWGMLRAVLTRQLNLTLVQWVILGGSAVVWIALAVLLAPSSSNDATESASPPAVEQSVSPAPAASPHAASVKPAKPAPAISPAASPESTSATAEEHPQVPGWASTLEEQLSPLADVVAWLYIVGDVILVVMATALLLAFWGGRFSLSWRFIAFAAFSFYISDIWFNYATNYIPNYQTGALPEVFWIFSGCLFAIGAALEYDLSTRRRSVRRRA